eukprot:6205086-Pleurochrysis_carterae.AAC.4
MCEASRARVLERATFELSANRVADTYGAMSLARCKGLEQKARRSHRRSGLALARSCAARRCGRPRAQPTGWSALIGRLEWTLPGRCSAVSRVEGTVLIQCVVSACDAANTYVCLILYGTLIRQSCSAHLGERQELIYEDYRSCSFYNLLPFLTYNLLPKSVAYA